MSLGGGKGGMLYAFWFCFSFCLAVGRSKMSRALAMMMDGEVFMISFF